MPNSQKEAEISSCPAWLVRILGLEFGILLHPVRDPDVLDENRLVSWLFVMKCFMTVSTWAS